MPKIIKDVRKQLITEAKRQINVFGYQNTTIRSIAKECNLAVGTVYNYFKSKEMLVATFMLDDWLKYIDEVKNFATNDKYLILEKIYTIINDFYKKYNFIFIETQAIINKNENYEKRHIMLREQLSQLIIPLVTSNNKDFVAKFIAEALISWSIEDEPFTNVYQVINKLL